MYGDGNTTVVIARISTLFWDNYDESWGIFKNPHFNSSSIFNKFCILGRMLHMMPLLRHALSLQNGLYRWILLWTIIPPTVEGCTRWCTSCEGPGRQKSASMQVCTGAWKLEIGKIGVVAT